MAVKSNSSVMIPSKPKVRSALLPEVVGMGSFGGKSSPLGSFRELYSQMALSSSLGPAVSLTTASITSPSPITGKIFHTVYPQSIINGVASSLHKERFMNILDGFLKLEHTFPTAVADSLTYGVSYYETFYEPPTKSDIMVDSGITRLGYVTDGDKYISTIIIDGCVSGFIDGRPGKGDVVCNKFAFIPIVLTDVRTTTQRMRRTDTSGLSVNTVEVDVEILHPVSYLEKAIRPYRMVELIENIIVYARVNRAVNYRVWYIENGSETKEMSEKIIHSYRSSLTRSESLSLNRDSYLSTLNPVPMNGDVFVKVKNGVGAGSINQVTSDVDIKALVDLDHFRDDMYNAVDTSSAYMNRTSELPSGIGDTSLTRLDVRYGISIRTKKRNAEMSLRLLTDAFAKSNGLPVAPTLSLAPVITNDVVEFLGHIGNLKSLKDSLSNDDSLKELSDKVRSSIELFF